MRLSGHQTLIFILAQYAICHTGTASLQNDAFTPEYFLVIQAFVDYSVGLASFIFEEYGS